MRQQNWKQHKNSIKKTMHSLCTQNIFSLALPNPIFKEMNVITHQTSDGKLPTEDIDKHQINMDKAHQIFHINKWINKPTESRPLAYVNQHVHQSRHPSFLWKCSIYDPLSLKINCKWHINSLKDHSMYLPFGKTHPSQIEFNIALRNVNSVMLTLSMFQ